MAAVSRRFLGSQGGPRSPVRRGRVQVLTPAPSTARLFSWEDESRGICTARIIKRMSFSLRSTSAGQDAYRAGRLEAGELEPFGLRALDAIGVRLAESFSPRARRGSRCLIETCWPSDAYGLAVAVCRGGIAYVLGRRRGRLWVTALAVQTAVSVALLASAPPGFTWDRSRPRCLGHSRDGKRVAVSRGPAWGLVVFIPGVAVELAVEQARGRPVAGLAFLGAPTSGGHSSSRTCLAPPTCLS